MLRGKFIFIFALMCLTSVLTLPYNGFGSRFDEEQPSLHHYPYPHIYDEIPVYSDREISKPFKQNYETPSKSQQKSNIITLPPTVTKSASSDSGLFSIVSSCALSVAKSAFGLILKAPALIFGSVIAFGICHFTPICGQLRDIDVLLQAKKEFVSFATEERIAKAADFVEKLVRKYRSMNRF